MTKGKYTLSVRARDVALTDYISSCRDAERVHGYCLECPNYGRTWSCPPFGFDVGSLLGKYERVLLVVARYRPECDCCLEEFRELTAERVRLEAERLLALEKQTGGLATCTIGKCRYCGDEECARLSGAECRHPELVRPSLESLGFDIVATLKEFFGITLEWSRHGEVPGYLTLVTGLFHNCPAAERLSEKIVHDCVEG